MWGRGKNKGKTLMVVVKEQEPLKSTDHPVPRLPTRPNASSFTWEIGCMNVHHRAFAGSGLLGSVSSASFSRTRHQSTKSSALPQYILGTYTPLRFSRRNTQSVDEEVPGHQSPMVPNKVEQSKEGIQYMHPIQSLYH